MCRSPRTQRLTALDQGTFSSPCRSKRQLQDRRCLNSSKLMSVSTQQGWEEQRLLPSRFNISPSFKYSMKSFSRCSNVIPGGTSSLNCLIYCRIWFRVRLLSAAASSFTIRAVRFCSRFKDFLNSTSVLLRWSKYTAYATIKLVFSSDQGGDN